MSSNNLGKFKDITGEKFAKLTAIRRTGSSRDGHSMWLFKCDCGQEKIFAMNEVKRTRKYSVKSCGCLKNQEFRNPKRQKIGKASSILYTYKKVAKDRGLSWELPDETFYKLIHTNCYYCGMEPNNKHLSYIYNGIDRMDNTLGYLPNNCVSCCKICNRMKMNHTINVFYNHVVKIYNHKIKPTSTTP